MRAIEPSCHPGEGRDLSLKRVPTSISANILTYAAITGLLFPEAVDDTAAKPRDRDALAVPDEHTA